MDTRNMVLPIDINSPVFKALLDDANKEIRRVLIEVYNENFDGGEITIKLKLGINRGCEEIPKVNEWGEMESEDYFYKRFRADHKVTSTLKKSYQQEGFYEEPKEIEYTGEGFIVKPIPKNQMTFFEERMKMVESAE